MDLKSRLERETGRGSVDCAKRVRLEAVTPVVVELESSWGREVSLVELVERGDADGVNGSCGSRVCMLVSLA